ncbi:hypothetical protein B0A49_00962 [Cryomyces minteri]|uniref:Uncharacterized protein n=1 Tax=Cryomyces minteri TaxID=331657 RepID=A0A4U0XWX0_9PEZI|nr:hypothetical protein B0A49_00962 [Cryomyces minteri]
MPISLVRIPTTTSKTLSFNLNLASKADVSLAIETRDPVITNVRDTMTMDAQVPTKVYTEDEDDGTDKAERCTFVEATGDNMDIKAKDFWTIRVWDAVVVESGDRVIISSKGIVGIFVYDGFSDLDDDVEYFVDDSEGGKNHEDDNEW